VLGVPLKLKKPAQNGLSVPKIYQLKAQWHRCATVLQQKKPALRAAKRV
jgi:hypothetical protein